MSPANTGVLFAGGDGMLVEGVNIATLSASLQHPVQKELLRVLKLDLLIRVRVLVIRPLHDFRGYGYGIRTTL